MDPPVVALGQGIAFDHETQRVTLADLIGQVLHQRERLARLDLAIDRAIESAPPEKKAVIDALQAMRGVASAAGQRGMRGGSPRSALRAPKNQIATPARMKHRAPSGRSDETTRGAILDSASAVPNSPTSETARGTGTEGLQERGPRSTPTAAPVWRLIV